MRFWRDSNQQVLEKELELKDNKFEGVVVATNTDEEYFLVVEAIINDLTRWSPPKTAKGKK